MKIHVKRDKKSVGWIQLKPLHHNGDIEIEYLYVHPAHRNQKIGTQLINRAKKIAAGTNLVGFVEPHPDSPITHEQEINWLEKLGFKALHCYNFGDCEKSAVIFISQKT